MDLLYSADQVRQIDSRAIEEEGIAGYVLMCRAGDALLSELLQRYPWCKSVSVVCGKGNNAGDGYVIARLAAAMGLAVSVEQLGASAALTGDAATARDALVDGGGDAVSVREHLADPDISAWGDVIVDALLGTGVTGRLRPPYAAAVRAMNASARPIFAVDVPTGVNPDTGGLLGPPEETVVAAATLSFIGRKRGLATGPALDYRGDWMVADLGVPRRAYRDLDSVPLKSFDIEMTSKALFTRAPNTYKQRHGHVLIVGGDEDMGGAIIMAALGAMRSGAGLVTVATRPRHQAALLARLPEVMVVDAESAQLEDAFARASVVGVGPGLGRAAWGERLFGLAMAPGGMAAGKPTVVDADGLYWLAKATNVDATRPLVVTPHAGEAANLLGISSAEVQANRFSAAQQIAKRYGASVILKGAGSIAAARSGAVTVCGQGNPGMATAGMGDVLTGIACALLAQSSDNNGFLATEAAMLLHSAAADAAVRQTGEISLIATDLVPEISQLLTGSS